MIEIKSLPII